MEDSNGFSLPFAAATTTISLPRRKPSFPPPKTYHNLPQPRHPEPELGVFSAERYFKDDGLAAVSAPPFASAAAAAVIPYPRPSPAASSEASWNSRTGLLLPPAPPPRRPSLWRLCPCSGKRSVDVEEKLSDFRLDAKIDPQPETRPSLVQLKLQPPPEWDDDAPRTHRVVAPPSAFSFPILAKPLPDDDDPPRDSLEVFRPRDLPSPGRMLRRWAPPPSEEMRRSFTFTGARVDDDVASDASSDLFEIESFSTGMASVVYRRRDSLDEAVAAAAGAEEETARPSACYPPSEASVQWSVATAEGFASVANFSSAASECGEREPEREAWGRRKTAGSGGGLLLMSCRSGKAVDVAPHPLRHATDSRRVSDRAALSRSLSGRAGRAVHGM